MLAFRQENAEEDGLLLNRGRRDSSCEAWVPWKDSEERLREASINSGLAAVFKEVFKDGGINEGLGAVLRQR